LADSEAIEGNEMKKGKLTGFGLGLTALLIGGTIGLGLFIFGFLIGALMAKGEKKQWQLP
jgi:hypothetical protein